MLIGILRAVLKSRLTCCRAVCLPMTFRCYNYRKAFCKCICTARLPHTTHHWARASKIRGRLAKPTGLLTAALFYSKRLRCLRWKAGPIQLRFLPGGYSRRPQSRAYGAYDATSGLKLLCTPRCCLQQCPFCHSMSGFLLRNDTSHVPMRIMMMQPCVPSSSAALEFYPMQQEASPTWASSASELFH